MAIGVGNERHHPDHGRHFERSVDVEKKDFARCFLKLIP